MSITSTSGVTSSTSSTGVSTTKTGSGLGTDDFLKLLVVQLKNQDPMNPTSGTEFLAQTAQFSVVEKLTQMNQQYADLIAGQKAVEATSLMGRSVSYLDSQGNSVAGLVSSVRFTSSGPVLRVGQTDVPLASVSAVTG